MPRRLKLMPDYECWPLWGMAPDEAGNIDPASLPLGPETVAHLARWAEAYDAALDRDDPARSAFPSPEAQAAFEAEGLALWHDLQTELGEDYEVHYFSEATGTLHAPPTR